MSPSPAAAPRRKVPPVIKALVALVAFIALGVLFVRTANDARSEAYSVSASHLRNWTLGIDTAGDADGALVSLRPPPELPMNFFRQLFSRQMESMGTPNQPGIPLVLRHEIPSDVTADEVLALARAAGLEQGTLTPKCVGFRRISDPGITRQLYFLWLDVPGFDRFRQSLVAQAGPAFNPAAMSTVLAMAAAPNFDDWLPIVVDRARDCIASVTVQ